MKILKLLILMFLVSYSLMFWFVYLNIFINGDNLLYYFKMIFTHFETILLFPSAFFLYKTLHFNF